MAIPSLAALSTGAPSTSRQRVDDGTGIVDDDDDEEELPDALAALRRNPLTVLPPELFAVVLNQLISDFNGATFYHGGMCRRMYRVARAWVVSKTAPKEETWALLYHELERVGKIPIRDKDRPSDDTFLTAKRVGQSYEDYFAKACFRARRERAAIVHEWMHQEEEANARRLGDRLTEMQRVRTERPGWPYVTLYLDETFILNLFRTRAHNTVYADQALNIADLLIAHYYPNNLKVVKAGMRDVNPDLYRVASEAVRSDKPFALDVVGRRWRLLQYVAPILRDDIKVIGKAMDGSLIASRWASDRLKWSNARVVASEIMSNRIDFRNREHFDPKLRQVLAVVLAAVQTNGMMLADVDEPLRSNLQVVFAAVDSAPTALQFVPRHLIGEFPSIALEAIRKSDSAFEFIPDELWKTDAELAAVCLRKKVIELQQVPELNDSHIVVLAAVRQKGAAIEYASERLKKNLEIVAEALHSEPAVALLLDPALVKEAKVWAVSERRGWYWPYLSLVAEYGNDW